MKIPSIVLMLLAAVTAGLTLIPALASAAPVCALAAMVLSLAAAGFLVFSSDSPASIPARNSAASPAPPISAPATVPPPAPPSADAEMVSFLGLLQEKGRLVDFLQDDISAYEDAQIGAAARVVHQGCRAVLKEHFAISPVSEAAEGTTVTVPTGPESSSYRLVGRISGEAPFSGTLVHKGWKTTSVKLPRLITPSAGLPVIAPAEVELR